MHKYKKTRKRLYFRNAGWKGGDKYIRADTLHSAFCIPARAARPRRVWCRSENRVQVVFFSGFKKQRKCPPQADFVLFWEFDLWNARNPLEKYISERKRDLQILKIFPPAAGEISDCLLSSSDQIQLTQSNSIESQTIKYQISRWTICFGNWNHFRSL